MGKAAAVAAAAAAGEAGGRSAQEAKTCCARARATPPTQTKTTCQGKPRQVGLAGSSAIVTAAFQCLMAFYQLGERDMRYDI